MRLRSRAAGPVHVRLVTEQTYEMTDQKQWLQLGGFEVSGSRAPMGAPGLAGGWRLAGGLEQAEPDSAGGRSASRAAARQYARRLRVFRSAVLAVGAGESAADARECGARVRGAGPAPCAWKSKLASNTASPAPRPLASTLTWRAGAWTTWGRSNRINTGELVGENVTPLTIPLQEAASGDLELIVRAHRDLPADSQRLDFKLPQPRAASVGSATVVVLPADNVDLKPLESRCTGLVRQYSSPSVKLPVRQQPPLVYQCDAGEAQFVADFHVATRTLSVAVASHVQLGLENGQVKQHFTYHVGREAVDDVALLVPEEVAEAGKLSIATGNHQLTWQPIETDTLDDGKPDLGCASACLARRSENSCWS